jgi:hypothetical protein
LIHDGDIFAGAKYREFSSKAEAEKPKAEAIQTRVSRGRGDDSRGSIAISICDLN